MKKLLINYNLLPAYKEYCFVYLFFNSFILDAPPRRVSCYVFNLVHYLIMM